MTLESRWQVFVALFPQHNTPEKKTIFLAGSAAAMNVHRCGWFPRTKALHLLEEIWELNERNRDESAI